jgi:ABC-2 type transport system permease protein
VNRQVLAMPLFFAINAIYQIVNMLGWPKVLEHMNPITYKMDALRTFMINGGRIVYGIGFDFGALIISFVILTDVATKIYPNVVK